MSDEQTPQVEVTVVVEDGHTGADGQAGSPRFRLRREWSEIRLSAPGLAVAFWAFAVALVAFARVDPWNEWKSWRKWLRADERGWELLIPGLLGMGATWFFIRAHDRWSDEGWSPEVVGMVLVGTGAAFGGVLWGLYCLGLRPFAG